MYRRCISDALSIWDSTTVNNSKSTNDTKNVLSIVSMFMCHQTDNLWYKLVKKVGKRKVEVTL